MADVLLQQALTWVVSNATSIGAVLLWLTKPLRDKLKDLGEQIKEIRQQLKDVPTDLGARLRELDIASTRCKDEHEATRRELDDVVRQFRELQQDFNACVSNEEFRAFAAMSNAKIEKVLEHLGFIRGRMRSGPPSE